MARISGFGVVVLAVVLSFLSALGGGFLALTLFEADLVASGRVVEEVQEVESAPVEAPVAPASGEMQDLRAMYSNMTGENEEWTLGLVEEISAMACDSNMTATQIMESGLARDISLELTDLEIFVEETRQRCP